jgi:hypothetical protein
VKSLVISQLPNWITSGKMYTIRNADALKIAHFLLGIQNEEHYIICPLD